MHYVLRYSNPYSFGGKKLKKHFYESLKKYKRLKRSSFHTPGHKCEMFKSNDLLSLDFTELPFTDSLYEANGIIAKAEENLSKVYGSKKSIFSCGGNTLCIQTMLALAAQNGGEILCDRLVHRSAVSAMAMLDIQPTWLKRTVNSESNLAEQISKKELEKILSETSNFKAIYLTTPSYHGVLQDIEFISNKCKKHDIPVLVDNAHGSHLMFTKSNLHPLALGANLVADSAHKTLPVLTGGAWLHINDEKFEKNAKNAMAIFGSTSPSYITMASMDICTAWLYSNGKKEFQRLEERVQNIKNLAKNKGIFIPESEFVDPCRITLGVWKIGYTGFEFRQHLYKFNIELEFCDENYVVLIATPFNTKKDWQRLKLAISKVQIKGEKTNLSKNLLNYELPETKLTLRQALTAEKVCVDLKSAKNKIAAQIACPCPPGVPVVMPGEKIGEYECEMLRHYGISEILVVK